MSTRVHELAKELKLSSKTLIDKLKTLRIDAKSHMSVLTEDNIKTLKGSLKPSPKASSKPQPPISAKSEDKANQPGSIESARKEFLLQRGAMKTASPIETKKPQTSQIHTTVYHETRRPAASSTAIVKPRPQVSDFKKAVKPAVASPTPASSAVSSGEQSTPAIFSQQTSEAPRIKKTEIPALINVKDLAVKLSVNPSELIQRLIRQGIFASINQTVNFETAGRVAQELGFEVSKPEVILASQNDIKAPAGNRSGLVSRATIVTFMGHVDHGKTSLLDAIRKTKVAASEAGGITQHIGAYEVFLPKGAITFLDTPGHEAFTAMRARGARVTDVVVLVVAADDGVMPQTEEAIDHAKAAGVPIVVAINKIDLPAANVERVKKELMERGLMSEDWGGKTVMVGVSAKTGKGINELLEMLALESDLLELRADPAALATGTVIEAELSKGSGVLATVLVQDGTLRVGDTVVVGPYYCRVRAMINDRGQRVKEALPSMPVALLGLSEVPKAGDRLEVMKDEKTAKEIAAKKQEAIISGMGVASHVSLEHLFEGIKAGKVEELKLIIKSDVQGSVEALRSTLAKIKSKNVRLNIIHAGIGDVTESDVMLAAASDAVVIGFHVGIVGTAREIAEREVVDVRFYEIIYEVNTAIEKAMEGLLEPESKEMFVGMAEVRQVFKVSKVGMIAGCTVQKGKIVRNFQCRVIRAGQKIHEGKVVSLKRFKDDAREVLEGFECGIGVSNFEELTTGDRIEVYEIQKHARKLE